MKRAKRDIVASACECAGVTRALGLLPTQPLLLALNYHRIGQAEECPYDPGVFSATAEELDAQVRFLKRRFHVVTLDEAIEPVQQARRPRGTAVLLTFDDGYRDNYETAFPVLSSHGVQGVFFLPTAFIGSNRLAWWDVIASLVKRSRRPVIELKHPFSHRFDVASHGARRVIEQVARVYVLESCQESEQFIGMLEEACGVARPDGAERCFLDWEEAAAMLAGGMAIGSHSHSHEILSRLPPQRQVEELSASKQLLEQRLGAEVRALAYPVGLPHSFSGHTREAAATAGYRLAFSFYGGFHTYGAIQPYDVRRFTGSAFGPRFRLQTTLAAVTGRYWF